MDEMPPAIHFDMQTAWLRRFKTDVESNVKAFALRLKEAMPEHVTVLESRPFLFGSPTITGVSVTIGEHDYRLESANGHLKATVAMIVRGITLSTKTIDPGEWFAQLAAETQKTAEHAKRLNQSLSAFMAS